MKSEHHHVIFENEITHWWYVVRRALVHDIIKKFVGTRTDLDILDIGSGGGALVKELERYGNATGLDTSAESLAFCKARGVKDIRHGSATATGMPSLAYDIVTCLDVLEHLHDDVLAIREVRRVLRHDGTAIIFVPAFMFLWGITDEESLHYRRYRLPEIEAKFKNEGFTIKHKTYFNTLLFPLIATQRIIVRALSLRVTSEVAMRNRIMDTIFFRIFSFERTLLRFMSFPFGVSLMLIVTKNSDESVAKSAGGK